MFAPGASFSDKRLMRFIVRFTRPLGTDDFEFWISYQDLEKYAVDFGVYLGLTLLLITDRVVNTFWPEILSYEKPDALVVAVRGS
jgi:hypothetical protein